MPTPFYVYALLDLDCTVRYIGKGKGARAYATWSQRNGRCRAWLKKLRNENTSPIVLFLEEELTESEAMEREIYWIGEFRSSPKLTNMTNGGDGVSGYRFSEESKSRMSANRKSKTLPPSVRKAISDGKRGKPHPRTPEWTAKIAAANRGRKMPPRTQEHRDKLSKSHTGKVLSDEHRLAISLSSKGKSRGPKSESHREALRQSKLGSIVSEETKLKISATLKGRVRSQEHSDAIREGHRKRKLNKKEGT
jgi:hypothetical protein